MLCSEVSSCSSSAYLWGLEACWNTVIWYWFCMGLAKIQWWFSGYSLDESVCRSQLQLVFWAYSVSSPETQKVQGRLKPWTWWVFYGCVSICKDIFWVSLEEDAEWLWSRACFLFVKGRNIYGNFSGYWVFGWGFLLQVLSQGVSYQFLWIWQSTGGVSSENMKLHDCYF